MSDPADTFEVYSKEESVMQSLTEGVALEHISTRLREAAEDRKAYHVLKWRRPR